MANSNRENLRSLIYYVALLLIFAAGISLILAAGSRSQRKTEAVAVSASGTAPTNSTTPAPANGSSGMGTLYGALRSPISVLLLQIVVIIVVARIFGAVFRRLGQPPVMGEMVAGIALGPSVLGLIFPQAVAFLFPASSMTTLGVLSQIGVVLFMFIVGLELDIQHLREKASTAVMVSHASIIVPFLLGAALALALYSTLAPAGTSFAAFALFMGIAMSITAFPVLARILEDRGMSQSRLGSIALACAAIDDVSAWCLLAFVIAIVKSSGLRGSVLTIALTLGFVAAMLFFIKPQLDSWVEKRLQDQKQARALLAAVLAFVLASAWFTESIGIHALFGGFMAGVVMPPVAGFRDFLKQRVEAFSSAALLPLFFVFTGLRTQISLLDNWWAWLTCLAIILVAITGKLGGSMLMARWTGMSWRDSSALGILMNTRGLVELVVLNIGCDLGILSGRIFVMMVIMALATTFMTAPLLSLVNIRSSALETRAEGSQR